MCAVCEENECFYENAKTLKACFCLQIEKNFPFGFFLYFSGLWKENVHRIQEYANTYSSSRPQPIAELLESYPKMIETQIALEKFVGRWASTSGGCVSSHGVKSLARIQQKFVKNEFLGNYDYSGQEMNECDTRLGLFIFVSLLSHK